ncbi:hypothetical protein Ancab_036468 [Ancistrocladus abbreviatus]
MSQIVQNFDQPCTYSCYSSTDSYLSPSPLPSNSDHRYQISPYVIIAIVLLASLCLTGSCYAVVVKYYKNRRSYRRDPPLARSNASEEDAFHDVDDPDHDQDPVAEYPIWLITTVGLEQSIINSITVVRYKKGDGLIEGRECSVCLSEFEEDETLRLLPKCNHAFHMGCIDTWLRSHINCPLCRASIVSNSGRPSMASSDLSFGHSRRTDGTQIVDLETSDLELGNRYTRALGTNENIVGAGRDAESLHIDVQSKVDVSLGGHDNVVHSQLVSVDEMHLLRRSISMDHLRATNNIYRSLESTSSYEIRGSSVDGNVGDCRWGALIWQGSHSCMLLRRSISMDHLRATNNIYLGLESTNSHEIQGSSVDGNVGDSRWGAFIWQGSHSSMFRSLGSSLQSLHANPAPIKRSLSWSGRVFS